MLKSFNSQRDGILLNSTRSRFGESTPFQFPTGWNSTHSTPKMVYDVYGFNSQRDGILLQNGVDYYTLDKRFQFPTGWNSTARIVPFF